MSILGNLIFGAALGGSAIKCAAENAKNRTNAKELPNGMLYWIDRLGKTRLMDGTIIHIDYFNGKIMQVEDLIHHKIIYDGWAIKRKNIINQNVALEKEVEKQVIVLNNKYPYRVAYHSGANMWGVKNLKTGEFIIRLDKYYNQGVPTKYKKWNYKSGFPIGRSFNPNLSYNSLKYDGETEISKEEFQTILEASSFKDYYPQSKFKNIVVEMDYRYFKESECGINE